MGQNSITMFTNDSGAAAGPNAYVQDVFTDVSDPANVNTGLTDTASTNPMGNLWQNDFTPRYGVKTLAIKSLALLSDRSKWISNKPTYEITWDESFPQIKGYVFGNFSYASRFGQIGIKFKTIGDGISINGIVRRVAFITNASTSATATAQVVVDGTNGSTVDFSNIAADADDVTKSNRDKFNAQVHASTNETKDIHDIRLTALQSNTLTVTGVMVYFENSGYNLEVNPGVTYVNKSQISTTVGATLVLPSYGSSLGGILNIYTTANAGLTYSALSATTIQSAGTGSSGTNLFTVTTGDGGSFLAGYGVVVPQGTSMYVGVIQSVSTDTLTLFPTLGFGLSNIIYRAWSASLAVNASFMQLSQSIDFTQMKLSPGISLPIFGPKGAYCFWAQNVGITTVDSIQALNFKTQSGFMQIDGYFSAAEGEFVGNGQLGITVCVNGLPTWSTNANSTGMIKCVLMNGAGPGWNSVNIQCGISMGDIGLTKLNLYTRRPDIGVSYGALASLETLQSFTDRGPAALSATFIALGTYKRTFADQLYLQGAWSRVMGGSFAGGVGYIGSSTNSKLLFQYYGKNVALIGVGASVAGNLVLDGNTIGATFNQMLIGATEMFHSLSFTVTAGTCIIQAVDFTRTQGELTSLQNYRPLPDTQKIQTPVVHEIALSGGSGFGSDGSNYRVFTAIRRQSGTAITLNKDAVKGDSFTINEDGVYAIVYQDGQSGATGNFGASVNSTQGTTTVDSIAIGNFLVRQVSVSGQTGAVAWTGNFKVGDIIRAHGSGTLDKTADTEVNFRIVKVG
jgi:hypothetical protein